MACSDPSHPLFGDILTVVGVCIVVNVQVGLPATAVGRLGRRGGFLHAAQWMRAQGPRAMFKGNGASCLRVLPYNCGQALLYANFAVMFERPGSSGKLSPAAAFVGGVGAASVAALMVYPLEVCQTRLSVQNVAPGCRAFSGIRDCLASTWRAEGMRGLYRGALPSVLGECRACVTPVQHSSVLTPLLAVFIARLRSVHCCRFLGPRSWRLRAGQC